jgi:uncharacterized Zn finger protein
MSEEKWCTMKCPNCKGRHIDVHEARGFTSKESPIKECECGHIWRVIPISNNKQRIDVIRQGESNLIRPEVR